MLISPDTELCRIALTVNGARNASDTVTRRHSTLGYVSLIEFEKQGSLA